MKEIFSAVQTLFCLSMKKLYSQSPLNTEMLHSLLKLLFYTALRFKECSGSTESSKDSWIVKELNNMWTEVSKVLSSEWIMKYCTHVFGGTSFRGSADDIEV